MYCHMLSPSVACADENPDSQGIGLMVASDHSFGTRALEYSLISEFPLRATERYEWPELVPLAFLVVQSRRPTRILEVGSLDGNSYLTFCQAVRQAGVLAECRCLPSGDRVKDAGRRAAFKAFVTYHDARYASFSSIATGSVAAGMIQTGPNFELVHIIAPSDLEELERVSGIWLTKLNPSGVALISGIGRLDERQRKSFLEKLSEWFSVRLLPLQHPLIMLSTHPVGLVADLLHSSPGQFRAAVELLGLLGDRVRLYIEHQDQTVRLQSLRRDVEQLGRARERDVEQMQETRKREIQQLEEARRREIQQFQADVEILSARNAELRRSEIDAEIRSAHLDFLLARERLEAEQMRRRLSGVEEDNSISEGRPSAETPSQVQENPDSGPANELLHRICDQYGGDFPSAGKSGKELWDHCGHSVLTAVLNGRRRLQFRSPTRAALSVIMVFYNKAYLSLLALCALLLSDNRDYEVFIVDNNSSDETSEMLSLVDGVTVIRNQENRGFGEAVMQAARVASGEFICLLNNDALLQPDALSVSANSFAERKGAGALGGKILLSDGALQEAGCIIWRDGRTHQYGRGESPDAPQYNFRRPVDYCSGVFLPDSEGRIPPAWWPG